MVGSGSSSRKKSSRKKSSKRSLEARKRKKSKKDGAKKLSRRRDSDSSYSRYSDDDSMSPVSISSSSSEDDSRIRKSKSRSKRDVKSRRKRERRRPSSSGSSENSPQVRKRKRSKKNGDSKLRKKSQKKRPRREASSSSASSDSWSCSTCQSDSSNSNEKIETKRSRDRSREKRKDKINSSTAKIGNKRSRSKSPAYSSHDRYTDSSYNARVSEEKLGLENNSRRLKSIITVVENPYDEKGDRLENDPNKEEIYYDHDDYPSPRSNDSNEYTNRKDLASESNITSSTKTNQEETCINEVKPLKTKGTSREIAVDTHINTLESQVMKMDNINKEISGDGSEKLVSSGGDELELILRQRALENLKKFRGGCRTIVETTASELSEENSVDELDKKVQISRSASAELDVHPIKAIERSNRPSSKRVISRDPEINRSTAGEVCISTGSGIRGEGISPLKQNVIVQSQDPKVQNHVAQPLPKDKYEIQESDSRHNLGGNFPPMQHAEKSEVPEKVHKSPVAHAIENAREEVSQSMEPESSSDGKRDDLGVANSDSRVQTLSKSIPQEKNLKDQQGEAKDGSQYEQKTMSVMRGSEMVQVSYKVYIPKKTPALARRQLRR